MLISVAQLRAILPRLPQHDAELFIRPLQNALAEFDVTTWQRVAAFVAQVGWESEHLTRWREAWGPTEQQKKYEPPTELSVRLGNTHAGDGYRFRGRGPIQLTGRDLYRRCGQALGVDLEASPEMLLLPEVGFRSSGWFWAREKKLNYPADKMLFVFITQRVNGGLTGLEGRTALYEKAREVLRPLPAV